MFSLANKTILVTGATGYLGKAMCLALCECGAEVLVNSRSDQNVNLLVQELDRKGFRAKPAVFDVCDGNSIDSWLSTSDLKTIHGIVNNAYAGMAGSIETSKPSQYRAAFEVSIVSAQYLFQKLLPLMRKTVLTGDKVSIVSVSSMYGSVSPDIERYKDKESANPPFYGASKAALEQWSKYGACEFSREGIRFNTISPGPFPNKDIQHNHSSFVKGLSKRVPMKRVGQAHEIGGPIVFLMSNESSFVNGINLKVDGGWTCW